MTSPCLVGEFEAGLIKTSAYLRTDCITLQVLRNKMVTVDGGNKIRKLEHWNCNQEIRDTCAPLIISCRCLFVFWRWKDCKIHCSCTSVKSGNLNRLSQTDWLSRNKVALQLNFTGLRRCLTRQNISIITDQVFPWFLYFISFWWS